MRYSLILLTATTIVVASPESATGNSSNISWQAGKQDIIHTRSLPDSSPALHTRSPVRNKGKAKGKAASKKESAAQQAQKSAKASSPKRPAVQPQDSPRHSLSSGTSGSESPGKSPSKSPALISPSSVLPTPRQRRPESFRSLGTSETLSTSGASSSLPRPPARKKPQSQRQATPPRTSNSPQRPTLPKVGFSRTHAPRQKESPDAAELRGSSSSSQGSPRSPATRRSGHAWEISHTTIQGDRQREGAGGGNSALDGTPISSPVDRSRSASPINRYRASTPTFNLWVAGAKEVLKESRAMSPIGDRGDPALIEAAARTRSVAKARRAAAREKLGEAQQLMYGGRAMSPTTQRAVVSSASYSDTAIKATKINAEAQSKAGTALIATDQHHRVDGFIKAGAREYRRTFSLGSHRDAFWSEYQARLSKEEADEMSPDNPDRGTAYGRAALSKVRAIRHAGEYYKHRDQYVLTKDEFGDPSGSSTDGEQELKDSPRRKKPH